MLFAACATRHARPAGGIWGRIEDWLRGRSLVVHRVGDGVVAATSPGRVERNEEGATAWLCGGMALAGSTPSGPRIELTPAGLGLTTGPLPQYPLYYASVPEASCFAACSELAPLALLVQSEVHLPRVVGLAAWQLRGDPGATVFEGIRRVRPCELLRVGLQGVTSNIQLPRAGQNFLRATVEELAEELRQRLDAAVARAIGEAKRIVVSVSGGLDSSGVLALAVGRCRGATGRDVEALSMVGASPGDDRPHLRALEESLGLVVVRHTPREAAPWFVRSLCADAQPQLFGAACLDMQLWRAAGERSADVALCGHGGDVVLGGDLCFAPLLLRGHPVRAVRETLALQIPWPVRPRARLLHWLLAPAVRPWTPGWLVALNWRLRHRAPWMTDRFVDLLESGLKAKPELVPCTPDEQMARFCTSPFFAELAVLFGQIASVTGTAAFDVFRDVELVRFVAQIDPAQLSHGHQFRGLYRLAMKGVLPESLRLRRDKASGEPAIAEAAVSANALALLQDLSTLRTMEGLGLARPEAFRQPFAEWLAALRVGARPFPLATDSSWHRVWQPLSVEAFLRRGAIC